MGQEARMAYCAQDSGVAVRGWGLLTGWGAGLQSLPTLSCRGGTGAAPAASRDSGSR